TTGTSGGTTSSTLSDGSWYFHLRTRDNVGNWSSPVHLGPYKIDTTAPIDPLLSSPSHGGSAWSNDPTVDIQWSGGGDGSGSGVDGYSYFFSQTPNEVPDATKDAEETATGTTSPALADGLWYF